MTLSLREELSRLMTELEVLLNQQNRAEIPLEIELRFARDPQHRLIELNRSVFNRVTQALTQNDFTPTLMLDEYAKTSPREREHGSRRPPPTAKYRQILNSNTGRTTYDRKEEIASFESLEYGYRIVVSQEQPLTAEQFEAIRLPVTVRNKHRQSIPLGSYQVDLTEVLDQESRVDFQLEIEFPTQVDVLRNSRTIPNLELIFRAILNSEMIDPLSLRNQVMIDFRTLLGDRFIYPSLDRNLLVQPVDLTYSDLIWGGLLGSDSGYTVTPKADGVRKLFFINGTGVWLIREEEMNHLFGYQPFLGEFLNTILDGELLPRDQIRQDLLPTVTGFAENQQSYIYLPYDCLCTSDQGVGIQGRPHPIRREVCEQVRSLFEESPASSRIGLYIKPFIPLTTPEAFFRDEIPKILDHPTIFYQTDGLIFTPINSPYLTPPLTREEKRKREKIPRSELLPLPGRVLRWKPPEKMSIDFSLDFEATGTQRRIILKVLDRNQLVPFTGTQRVPYPGGPVEGLPLGARKGEIYELRWIYPPETDLGINPGHFAVIRPRPDKTIPNQLWKARSIWQLLQNPIHESVLRGNTFDLVRRYHNRIKSHLLEQLVSSGQSLVLLDLGSGRGSDVDKWRGLKIFRRVVAVEKDPQNFAELQRRVGQDQQIIPLLGGAEETGRIQSKLTQSADVISLMLVLTHFWDSYAHVQQLAQTIQRNLKPGGRILFLTMDGDLVQQALAPPFRALPYSVDQGVAVETAAITELDLFPASLRYLLGSPPKIWIDIPGSMVRRQTEYLVHLSDLLLALGPGYRIGSWKIANQENFLTQAESKFTSLYSYGWIQHYPGTLPPSPRSLTPEPEPATPPVEILPACHLDLGQIGLIQEGPIPPFGDPSWLEANGSARGDGEVVNLDQRFGVVATLRGPLNWVHALLSAFSSEYRQERRYIPRALMAKRLALRLGREPTQWGGNEELKEAANFMGLNLLILVWSQGRIVPESLAMNNPGGPWIVLLRSYGHYNPVIDRALGTDPQNLLLPSSHQFIRRMTSQ